MNKKYLNDKKKMFFFAAPSPLIFLRDNVSRKNNALKGSGGKKT